MSLIKTETRNGHYAVNRGMRESDAMSTTDAVIHTVGNNNGLYRYQIAANSDGTIEITALDGNLTICPHSANVATIQTR